MTTPDPAAIAKGLTPKQKEAMLRTSETGSFFATVGRAWRTNSSLVRMGLLVTGKGFREYCATPLGVAVREELKGGG